MGILEGILYMIWRGIAIGVIISAPMGPVGILCVQRTLDKGRKAGLYTGVGAAISDLIYCLLTGFGLSFIEEFLEKNQNVIQLVGSVVLIAFGVYLFKANPSRKLKKPSEQRIPAGRNILNGFLFTFSNPLIIFLIIGLFARFNFLLPDIRFYHYMIGFVSIFAGALVWWYIVTLFIDKVRAHFNLRSMWLINKIIGVAIFLFAIVGIVSATSGIMSASEVKNRRISPDGLTNNQQGSGTESILSDFTVENGGGMPMWRLSAATGDDFTFEFRAASLNNKEKGKSPFTDLGGNRRHISFPEWGIGLLCGRDSVRIMFRTSDNRFDETYTSPGIDIRLEVNDVVREKKSFFTDLDIFDGENSFRLVKKGDEVFLYGGNREYQPLLKGCRVPADVDSIGFIIGSAARLKIRYPDIEYAAVPRIGVSAVYTDSVALVRYLERSPDPIEGIWTEFDRVLEEDNLRMGGDYRLALLKNGRGYDIVYISGALKNPGLWKRGMLKGRLSETPFEGVFDVEWLDASGHTVWGKTRAQYESPLLRFHFSGFSSELRLGKIIR